MESMTTIWAGIAPVAAACPQAALPVEVGRAHEREASLAVAATGTDLGATATAFPTHLGSLSREVPV